ncbi:MAG: extracellular solute-binding protein [Lachnospiraceae bacterium]|nr:extracellular solute-binding protein [Lachnospiraceae bacterium]
MFQKWKKTNSKYKEKIAVILCATLLIGTLFGCSDTSISTSKKTVYSETITVDVFDSLANYQGIQSGWFAKIVKDKFNIELNIIAPNVAGGGDAMYETRAAAGNLGDLIICSGNNNNLYDLVTAGLVMDMSELLENKNIMQYEAAIRNLNDPISDTAIYAIPSEVSSKSCLEPSENSEPTFGPYLRYDLYTAIGSPQMETLEDLLPVLKRMQEAAPISESGNPTYGFSFFKDWDGNLMNAAKQPACFYGYEEYGFSLYRVDGSDYQDILDSDSIYQRILKLYFDANQLGLVDPDSPNQNYTAVYDKCAQGDILFSYWPWLGKSAYNTVENRESGKGFMFVPIDDLQVLSNGCRPMGSTTAIIAIGTNAEDPDRLAAFIDWLYSPEGIYANSSQLISGTAGPEGLTWKMTDNGPALTEFGIQTLSNNDLIVPEEWGGGTWSNGISELNFNGVALIDDAPNGYPYYYTLWDSYRESENTTLDIMWENDMNAETALDYLITHNQLMISPGVTYQAPPESSEITTIRNQCRNIIVDYSWKMVFAKDEATFYSLQEEMQTSARSLGYEQVLAEDMENVKKQSQLHQESILAEQQK